MGGRQEHALLGGVCAEAGTKQFLLESHLTPCGAAMSCHPSAGQSPQGQRWACFSGRTQDLTTVSVQEMFRLSKWLNE